MLSKLRSCQFIGGIRWGHDFDAKAEDLEEFWSKKLKRGCHGRSKEWEESAEYLNRYVYRAEFVERFNIRDLGRSNGENCRGDGRQAPDVPKRFELTGREGPELG